MVSDTHVLQIRLAHLLQIHFSKVGKNTHMCSSFPLRKSSRQSGTTIHVPGQMSAEIRCSTIFRNFPLFSVRFPLVFQRPRRLENRCSTVFRSFSSAPCGWKIDVPQFSAVFRSFPAHFPLVLCAFCLCRCRCRCRCLCLCLFLNLGLNLCVSVSVSACLWLCLCLS